MPHASYDPSTSVVGRTMPSGLSSSAQSPAPVLRKQSALVPNHTSTNSYQSLGARSRASLQLSNPIYTAEEAPLPSFTYLKPPRRRSSIHRTAKSVRRYTKRRRRCLTVTIIMVVVGTIVWIIFATNSYDRSFGPDGFLGILRSGSAIKTANEESGPSLIPQRAARSERAANNKEAGGSVPFYACGDRECNFDADEQLVCPPQIVQF